MTTRLSNGLDDQSHPKPQLAITYVICMLFNTVEEVLGFRMIRL